MKGIRVAEMWRLEHRIKHVGSVEEWAKFLISPFLFWILGSDMKVIFLSSFSFSIFPI